MRNAAEVIMDEENANWEQSIVPHEFEYGKVISVNTISQNSNMKDSILNPQTSFETRHPLNTD